MKDQEQRDLARAMRGGVRGLSFMVHVYEDHSIVTVTRKDFVPLRGADLRLGHIRIGVGREHLAGVPGSQAVRLVAVGILTAVSDQTVTLARRDGVGVPLGTAGGTVTEDPLPGL